MSSTYAHRHINFMAMRENFAMIWKTFHHFYKFFATAAHEFCINEKKISISHDDAVLWVRERFEWVNRKRRKSEEEEEKLSLTDRRSETKNDKKELWEVIVVFYEKFYVSQTFFCSFLNAAIEIHIYIFLINYSISSFSFQITINSFFT